MAKFQVEQYFHVSLSLLKLGRALPFTLHIYLPVNDRIVPLIHSGEVYGQRTADLLASRRINEVHILVSDRAAYEEYVKAEGMTPEPMAVGVQEPAPTPPEIAPPDTKITQDTPAIEEHARDKLPEPLTPAEVVATGTEPPVKGSVTIKGEAGPPPAEKSGAETIGPIEVVATGTEPPAQEAGSPGTPQHTPQYTPPKAAQAHAPQGANVQPETQHTEHDASESAPAEQVAPLTPVTTTRAKTSPAPRASQRSSRKLASRIFSEDPGASEQALSTSRKIIGKLLEGANEEEKKLFDVFAALDAAGQQGYSSSVASYCVLFAMGIGYSDVETLRDLAVASLLHDIGTTQLPPGTVWTPRNQQTPSQRREFVEHVRLGKKLLESLGFKPNARVAALIEAHHEKFDGTGYPEGIRGEKLTELSQVLSLSDFLHSLSTGYFDGKKRSPHESFAYLREIENDPLFPHYFNPNLFRRIVDWVDAGSSSGPPLAAAS